MCMFIIPHPFILLWFTLKATASTPFPRFRVNFSLTSTDLLQPTCIPLEWKYHTAEEEIRLGPACWLWDYLRRSGQGGFFLPLSGGIDSSSTACIVASMCHLLVDAVKEGGKKFESEVKADKER